VIFDFVLPSTPKGASLKEGLLKPSMLRLDIFPMKAVLDFFYFASTRKVAQK
jgi:hypothetical protein